MTTAPTILESLVLRAGQLYSLPRVAVEVLDLTSQNVVDVRRLKQVIETDPALTAKVLRVVNSSLYGLSRQVADLNEALALLGTKPLKLFVLGFSLPDGLFSELAGDLLQQFWRHTLTRAVAAREISQTFCQAAGDEAFIAGLLRDLGQLVLVRELGTNYVDVWRTAAQAGGSLAALERRVLGFDHTQLTARLLEQWKMPSVLVEAVAAPDSALARGPLPTRSRELRHTLHLAELAARLLAGRRLDVLSELVEASHAWLHINYDELIAFLAMLQDKVAQLAEVMSIPAAVADADVNHTEMLRQAHAQLAEVAVDAATELVRHALDDSPEALQSATVWALSETVASYARWHVSSAREESSAPADGESSRRRASAVEQRTGLRDAEPNPAAVALSHGADATPLAATPAARLEMKPVTASAPPSTPPTYVAKELKSRKVFPQLAKADRPAPKPEALVTAPSDDWPGLAALVATSVAACRTARVPLSLVCLEVCGISDLVPALDQQRAQELRLSPRRTCAAVDHEGLRVLAISESRVALVLPDCKRSQAVEFGDELLASLRADAHRLAGDAAAVAIFSAGVATVARPPKNFPAHELIDRAARCLYAAHSAGSDCLKSIEIL